MPIPFLIVGLVAAATAVVAAVALSDDDKPSSSGSSSDRDIAERRREVAAEKERKTRERAQKQEAAHEYFQKDGRVFGRNLAQALPSDLVEASLHKAFTLDSALLKKGNMQLDMEVAFQRDTGLKVIIDGLETILTKRASHQKIIQNLAIFSELYKPTFQCKNALRRKRLEVTRIDNGIEELKKIKTQLMKLECEDTSI